MLIKISEAPGGKEILEAFASYWMTLGEGLDVEEVESRIVEVAPRAKDAVMTAAEKLIAKGRDEGRIEGRDEGLVEGMLLGSAGVLMRQLTKKFGELPEGVRTRVDEAREEELNAWAERVLTADSLEAVFAKE